ncbi:fringe glycosyltransferase-like [Rhagoletis pomonella]|uniref:fringe glycosyltransferase-like n=2 Tax=Rhagoletis TaxID=28609 RepID=UPI0017820E8D|nr:fringe glycosyltransferase-like [Rhagoletis pomonella]
MNADGRWSGVETSELMSWDVSAPEEEEKESEQQQILYPTGREVKNCLGLETFDCQAITTVDRHNNLQTSLLSTLAAPLNAPTPAASAVAATEAQQQRQQQPHGLKYSKLILWFCHFDDDNYVNVPRLVKLLDEYSPSVDWYLGKPSIFSPLEIHLESYPTTSQKNKTPSEKISFWFATGGAGFCLSRALTMKMLPIAGGGKFISIGRKIRFPDDVTMGFIIEHLLKVPLRIVENFHSHLEPMEHIRPDTFPDQVSFSYAHMRNQWNVIKVDGFDLAKDPKRFYSLHCKLFPYFSFCPPR